MRIDNPRESVRPSPQTTPPALYSLSPRARRNKRVVAAAEQNFLDGQVNCPRKGPMNPQIAVSMCVGMHTHAPDECTKCACRLHLVAESKSQEIKQRSRT